MTIDLLQEPSIRDWCRRLRMPAGAASAVDEFVRVAQFTQANPELLRIFTALHEQMAVRGEFRKEWGEYPIDPPVQEAFDRAWGRPVEGQPAARAGNPATLFYLLAYMSALPRTEQRFREMGIPLEIFEATIYDITFYLMEYRDVHGCWGFNEFGWIWLHLDCRIFRLGRLQFVLEEYNGHAAAFRHKATGEIRLLCGDGFALRANGAARGAGAGGAEGEPAEEEVWHAVLEEREDGWFGNPIHPRGYALREPVLLPKTEWAQCLKRGDTVLDLHIPRGKTFTEDEIRDSFRQAREFFARYFPLRPYQAAHCHTWFFTPQLQTLLPPESSIVRFQREFYLYPHPGGPGFLWRFVFGGKYPDRATAPRDTALRRAVLDWLAAGHELYDLGGLMFHGPEEYGSQPYMRRWEG